MDTEACSARTVEVLVGRLIAEELLGGRDARELLIGVGTEDLGQLGVEAAQGELLLTRGTVIIGSQVASSFWRPANR